MGFDFANFDKFIYFISLIVYVLSILIIVENYSIKENILSPLNLFVLGQILVIIFQFLGLFSNELFIQYTANYFRSYIENNLDYYLISLNALLYALFNIFVFLSLIILKYTPINSSNKSFDIVATQKEVVFFVFVGIGGILFSIIIFGPQKLFNPIGILEYRYFIEHGYIVLLLNIVKIFLICLLVFLLFKTKRNLFFTISLFIFFLFFGFISGTGGFIIFSIMFIFFLKYSNLTIINEIARFFNRLSINKKVFLVVAFSLLILGFYYFYSITIRGYEGGFLRILSQRFDYYIASYIALAEKQIGFNVFNMVYPIISYVPRALYPYKLYPVNAQLTYNIFGFCKDWSTNFGVVGECMYVFPIVWLVVCAIITALSLKTIRLLLNKNFYLYMI